MFCNPYVIFASILTKSSKIYCKFIWIVLIYSYIFIYKTKQGGVMENIGWKDRVLFVCVHNSARSQMAEAFLNNIAGDMFEAESAGFEPGVVNPLAIEAMQEIGIDISNNKSDSVLEFFKEGKRFNYVITVCDESNAQRCPIFPLVKSTIHWSFKDPSQLNSDHETNMQAVRAIRDSIKEHIEHFVKLVKEGKLEGEAPETWTIKKMW